MSSRVATKFAEPAARSDSREAAGSSAGQPAGLGSASASAHPFELDTVASRWQWALDSAQRALTAAAGRFGPPAGELEERRRGLAHERQEIAQLLVALARETGAPAPHLSAVAVTARMLGLDDGVKACVFDLDFVLTDSAAVHSAAWAEVFDAFLLGVANDSRSPFRPFDRVADYRGFVDGRARLEGVHAFLESRGIRVPEGRPDDPSDAGSAYGLARRKGAVVARMLRQHGVAARPSARRYLEACGQAGVQRAVVSASTNTASMLELAHLGGLVDARVDADAISAEGLLSRPAPDLLIAACRRVGVGPDEAVSFTHTPAGVAGARAAAVTVIGVADQADAELLRGYGAERVVSSLGQLLDSRDLASRTSRM
jgi:beta-phosphoglucomutase-like phosphatase (HAD superfamily)